MTKHSGHARRTARSDSVRRRSRPRFELLESRVVLSTFTVTNTDDSGPGSLRQAILDANASDGEADVIAFDIPGEGPHTIAPATPLPIVWGAGPITIDATTQPGYDPDGLHPIELSGQNIDITGMNHQLDPVGLNLQASDSLIKGLAINRFATGILVNQHRNRVEGNYLGLDPTGTFVPGPRIYTDWGAMYNGIFLTGHDCTIGGSTAEARNVISGNFVGIWAMHGAGGNRILGNFFSTDREGLRSPAQLQNFTGIWLLGSSFNQIGEPGAGNRFGSLSIEGVGNSVQGNYFDGGIVLSFNTHDNLVGGSTPGARNVLGRVAIQYGAHHNKVQGNYIGMTADGTQRFNDNHGHVSIWMSHDNVIGTDGDGVSDDSEGNVIGGGVSIAGGTLHPAPTVNNVVAGNLIGTDATGMIALGPHPRGDFQTGILVASDASFTRIGTNGDGVGDEAERNVVSGGWTAGISSLGESTVIAGNYVGTDRTGAAALPNGGGITFWGLNGRVGTDGDGVNDASERNVISGNLGPGLTVGGIGNRVAGNFIGTDATGLLPLGNQAGILFWGEQTAVTIGGTTPGAGNVISGNREAGIDTIGWHAPDSGLVVQGNLIGVDRTGTGPLGNGGDGIWLRFGAFNITVGAGAGGSDPAAGNVIAFNGRNGITVSEGLRQFTPVIPATANPIRGNAIHSNAGLGIDLVELQWDGLSSPSDPLHNSYVFGVTPNDALDADGGNNQLQNFPVLAAAVTTTTTRVQGTLNSAPNGTFILDFYANSAVDPSGHGEGERWLGSATVMTDTHGDAAFDVVLASATAAGEFVTATATDPDGNTSEFSAGVAVVDGAQTIEIDVRQEVINLDQQGRIAVAILTTLEFDARLVEAASVLFAGAAAVQHAIEDVDGDGDLDMVLHFRVQDTALRSLYEQLLLDDADEDGVLDSTRQVAQAALTGETVDGALFEGSDEVTLFLAGKTLRNLLRALFPGTGQ